MSQTQTNAASTLGFGSGAPAQTGNQRLPGKAVPAGCTAILFNRAYSDKFKPVNGTYTADMNGRIYANFEGLGHFRTTRVVATAEMETIVDSTGNRVRRLKPGSVSWSTNPADANPVAAGMVSASLQQVGYIKGSPVDATYPNHDADGNLESTSLAWESCSDPDPRQNAAPASIDDLGLNS